MAEKLRWEYVVIQSGCETTDFLESYRTFEINFRGKSFVVLCKLKGCAGIPQKHFISGAGRLYFYLQ